MDNSNRGSFSKNTRKEKDSHADIKGKATVAGVEYWIDGWQKENDKGIWYSLSFTPRNASTAPLEDGSVKEGAVPF